MAYFEKQYFFNVMKSIILIFIGILLIFHSTAYGFKIVVGATQSDTVMNFSKNGKSGVIRTESIYDDYNLFDPLKYKGNYGALSFAEQKINGLHWPGFGDFILDGVSGILDRQDVFYQKTTQTFNLDTTLAVQRIGIAGVGA